MKIRFIFVLLALSVLVIPPPVMGYTVLEDYTLTNTTTAPKASFTAIRFNATKFAGDYLNNITKIEYHGYCYPNSYGQNQSFISNDFVLDGSTAGNDGNVTLNYQISPGLMKTTHTCDITIEFQNKNAITSEITLLRHLGNMSAWVGPDLYYLGDGSWRAGSNQVVFVSSSPWYAGHYTTYTGTAMSVPVADFTGAPLSGASPQLISLTDNSTGPATTWNWSGSGPGDLFFSSLTTQNTTVYLNTPGNYTITHGSENALGSDIETKTDYIWIYNDTSTSSTGCLAISGPTGQRISGAQVDLYDIENSSWSNTTTTMGLGTITTLKGHTINCYASATGFEDGDLLAQPENNQQYYTLPLWPSGGYRNVSEGWVTLYVTVTDLDTGQPIAGATVSGGDNNYGTILNSSAFSLTTNSQGLANVPVLNNTVVYLTAYKAGYTTLTAAVNTGTGSGGDAKVTHWFKLSKGAITVVPSMTTLPGGGYPTTQRTIDPAGTPDPAGGSSAYSSAKGQQMMDYLAMNGMDLVQLCFLVTVLGLLGIKLGK